MNTLNAKGRKFSWSYSALNDYKNCPSKYAHARFYCTLPFQETEALRWGNRVHKAAEMFLKGVPHKDIDALLPVEEYVTAMLRSGCRLTAELEITLTEQFKPTTWFAEDAWLRAKLDVVIEKGNGAVGIYDFKTGKNIRNDPTQLRLNAAALSIVRHDYQLFDGSFIWTAHKQVAKTNSITRKEIPSVWQEFLPAVEKMQKAWEDDNFPATPSGLCPWCAVGNCTKRQGVMR